MSHNNRGAYIVSGQDIDRKWLCLETGELIRELTVEAQYDRLVFLIDVNHGTISWWVALDETWYRMGERCGRLVDTLVFAATQCATGTELIVVPWSAIQLAAREAGGTGFDREDFVETAKEHGGPTWG